jgi:hypothetical protein
MDLQFKNRTRHLFNGTACFAYSFDELIEGSTGEVNRR